MNALDGTRAALVVAGVLGLFCWCAFGDVGAFLAFVVGDVLRVRRVHVEQSMIRAGIVEPRRTARAMYRNLGRGLSELVRMALRPGRPLPVQLPAELLDRSQGAVVATAHTGNWDLVACAAASRVPLTVVTKHFSVGLLDHLWQGARRARGVQLVGEGSAARAVSAALGRGELVAMLIDQAPERTRGAVRVPFLGASAWVDLAPALAALRARVPLVVAFPRRRDDGSHTLDVVAVLGPPARPNRQWAVAAMTEATGFLEAFVRAHPEQWLWMHRRWKEAPPSSVRARQSGRLAGVSS